MSILNEIWESTGDLYTRHELDRQTTPPSKRRRFLNEEHLEVMEASIKADYRPYYNPLAEEAADLTGTLCGLLQAHDIGFSELESACRQVIAKNNAKTRANGLGIVKGKISKLPTP